MTGTSMPPEALFEKGADADFAREMIAPTARNAVGADPLTLRLRCKSIGPLSPPRSGLP